MTTDLQEFLAESNRIEGYDYDPGEYDEQDPCHPDPVVENSIYAWDFIKANLSQPKLTFYHIENLHECVMRDLMRDPADVGRIRTRPVFIRYGGNTEACLEPSRVPKAVDKFVHLWNNKSMHPLPLHYFFECIHPFMDGNGRTGRFLWLWDILRRNQGIRPFLNEMDCEGDFYTKRQYYYMAIQNFRDTLFEKRLTEK